MNGLKKILGILWIAIAVIVGYFGITVLGIPKITSGKQEDLVFGIIIFFVLMPIISGGMAIFGLNGFVIGPVIAAMFIAVWDIFSASRAEAQVDRPDR